ncbi:MAG: type II toxin-antitoxin system HicA family toxin [Trueperaceae bacterium]|nr:MAG: type II toxin-antitoxin system HicA family toxin [Trueperaceae bacterium]
MSPKLPSVSGKSIIRALRKSGFVVDRVKGSHHIMTHRGDPTRCVVVPVHGNKTLKSGTVRNIIKQTGLSVAEFIDLL